MADKKNKDEEVVVKDGTGKKKTNPIVLVAIIAVIVIAINAGVAFMIVKMLGPNVAGAQQQSAMKGEGGAETLKDLTAEVIKDGADTPIMLKGGKEVLVVQALKFKVGSEECRALLAENSIEVKEAINMLFLNKTRSEVTTPDSIELIKKQMKDKINELSGYVGEKESQGVVKVILVVKAISSIN